MAPALGIVISVTGRPVPVAQNACGGGDHDEGNVEGASLFGGDAIASVACASTGNTSTTSQPERTSQVGSQAPSSPTINDSAPGTIPAGQEVDVRLRTTLSSETATVEQRFETTTVVDLVQNGRVLVPAGSVIRGVVSDVDKAGRVDRDGSLTLTFDRLSVNGRERDIRGSATQIFESKGIREEGTWLQASAPVLAASSAASSAASRARFSVR